MSRQRRDQASELVGDRVRIFQRGRNWSANFQLDGRQRRESLRTTSKKEARRRALVLEARLLDGRYKDRPKPPPAELVVEEYMRYLRTERRAVKTIVKYQKVFDRLQDLLRLRCAATILELDLKAVDAYRHARVAAGAAPKTVYTESVIVRQLVNFALSRGLITDDPLRGLKILEPKPTPQPCWTAEEVERILASSPESYRAALTLLADTGMRVGELAHLTWGDVDLRRNVLHVRGKEGWKPKSGDQRAIPISPRVRAMLERLPRHSRWVVTAPPSRRYPRGDHQVSDRRLLSALKRVLGRLGLPGHTHTFRHAFISRSLTAGIPEAVVREWVGHVDRDILRLYTHIASATSQAAMRRLTHESADTKEGTDGSKDDERSSAKDSARFQHKAQEEQNE